MNELAKQLSHAVQFLNDYRLKFMQQKGIEQGYTVPQMKVLVEVLFREKSSVKQLAINLRMTQSTVSDIVERLVSKGDLQKRPSTEDKRISEISLTEQVSADILQALSEQSDHAMGEVLDYLTDEQREVVAQAMRILVGAVVQKMQSEGYDEQSYMDVVYLCK